MDDGADVDDGEMVDREIYGFKESFDICGVLEITQSTGQMEGADVIGTKSLDSQCKGNGGIDPSRQGNDGGLFAGVFESGFEKAGNLGGLGSAVDVGESHMVMISGFGGQV